MLSRQRLPVQAFDAGEYVLKGDEDWEGASIDELCHAARTFRREKCGYIAVFAVDIAGSCTGIDCVFRSHYYRSCGHTYR